MTGRISCWLLVATLASSLAGAGEQTLRFGRFGAVTVYRPVGTPRSVALFVSGDGGWNQGVVDMARVLPPMGTLVVGIDIRRYLASFATSKEKCAYAAADFEELSQYVQQHVGLPAYTTPVLVGYSSGATLVYAALAQAPPGTFRGALSLGFCPDLPLHKPMCRGRGLAWTPGAKGGTYVFRPATTLAEPWIALQGLVDQVCDAKATESFVAATSHGSIVKLPGVGHGFAKPAHWLPSFKDAFGSLAGAAEDPAPAAAPSAAEPIADLPLVELRAPRPGSHRLALILSGDGGWAGLDREVGGYLSEHGVDVVGLNSLRYFWSQRSPAELAKDVERVARHYAAAWSDESLVLVGYSSGADVLPFVPPRLSPEVLANVRLVALLAPARSASFQFHVSDWLASRARPTDLPVLPEVRKIAGPPVLCFYGADEEQDSLCPLLGPPVRVIRFEGGHHFGGDYRPVAEKILAALGPAPPAAPR